MNSKKVCDGMHQMTITKRALNLWNAVVTSGCKSRTE